jgi:hypothetical protein
VKKINFFGFTTKKIISVDNNALLQHLKILKLHIYHEYA